MPIDSQGTSPEIQFDEAKTREAARLIGVSYEVLKFTMRVEISDDDLDDDDLELYRKEVAGELPQEFIDNANDLWERIKRYIEGDITHFRAFEAAMDIDPYLKRHVEKMTIFLYCDKSLDEGGCLRVEKIMEMDPKFEEEVREMIAATNFCFSVVLAIQAERN